MYIRGNEASRKCGKSGDEERKESVRVLQKVEGLYKWNNEEQKLKLKTIKSKI